MLILNYFDDNIKPLHIKLYKLNGPTEEKHADILLKKYNEIWNRVKDLFGKYFDIKAVAQRCSLKKAFLAILQNSQENTCASLFLK